MKLRAVVLTGVIFVAIVFFSLFVFSKQAKADINVFASPVQGGCYIAAPNDCRIHVEPFTIYLNPGSKLVYFQLLVNHVGVGYRVIYDFKPDTSNPVPFSGSTYTPSLVAQDFAATCGASYQINLQGRDTLDPSAYNLGLTGQFTCPSTTP